MKFKPECPSISEIAQYLLDCALELSRIADESQTAPATARDGRLQPESDNSLLYAVYAAEDNGSYLAVCLDDPFCYASGRDRESAIPPARPVRLADRFRGRHRALSRRTRG